MMKLLIVTLLCALVAIQGEEYINEENERIVFLRRGPPEPPPRNPNARIGTWYSIQQKVDNFDPNNKKTWSMRYLANSQFLELNGPMLIMIGGEWEISTPWVEGGLLFDIAQKTRGWMFYTEHRYYGRSWPTSDLSTENMKYLTVSQALEDIAVLIRKLKMEYAAIRNSKVMVVGGSYAGNLAIWMREKYPDLVDAAISSSAPVRAKVNFPEYLEVVKQSLGDPKCYGAIQKGVAKAQELINSGLPGLNQLWQDFKTCSRIIQNRPEDVAYFFNVIATNIGNIIQYSTPEIIQDTCRELTDPLLPNEYERLAAFMRRLNGWFCSGNYDSTIRKIKDISKQNIIRPWIYQSCNEFGYMQTSLSEDHLFRDTIPLALKIKMCADLFGQEFTEERLERTAAEINAKYGGLNPDVTKVISVHGSLDPWKSLGLTHDLNEEAPVRIVNGTSHCADISVKNQQNTPEMMVVKELEIASMIKWLRRR